MDSILRITADRGEIKDFFYTQNVTKNFDSSYIKVF
jgi:hypothetical protein